MAAESILPFYTITINETEYGRDDVVYGTGTFRANKTEARNVTSDGVINKDIITGEFEASCTVYGDQSALNTAGTHSAGEAGEQDEITILSLDLYGTVTAVYDDRAKNTRLTMRGKLATLDPLLGAVAVDGTTGGDLLA